MSTQETFNQLMTDAEMIALATENTAGHTPSVRFVFFAHDAAQPNVLFFGTAPTADKVAEIAANPVVSFETSPVNFQTVRVTGAKVTVSGDRDAFFTAMDAKYPSFARFTPEARAAMHIYAATFTTALVNDETLTF